MNLLISLKEFIKMKTQDVKLPGITNAKKYFLFLRRKKLFFV